MKKKIIIVSVFAALLMLSMPVMSSIQARTLSNQYNKQAINRNDCKLCPKNNDLPFGVCIFIWHVIEIYMLMSYLAYMAGDLESVDKWDDLCAPWSKAYNEHCH